MTIARSSGVLLGTDETTGVTVTNNNTSISSEKDFLGDDTSTGELSLFIKFTSTVTAGSVDVKLYGARVTGQPYPDSPVLVGSIAPINGTKKVQLNLPWQRFPAGRYMYVAVTNNATGADLTNVTVGYELTKLS